ncbi:hypothetical protein SAMN02910418_01557 [Bowdeniella nasicola]|uniref:Uncharacterized protein n=2 Tax=Bowdeniella nasicola TaxID=208480 RepID=A0A1H4B3K9_9ACTO|nr:hypothetical protein SAMN02910418_01557 [Bowdeniella nasicola]
MALNGIELIAIATSMVSVLATVLSVLSQYAKKYRATSSLSWLDKTGRHYWERQNSETFGEIRRKHLSYLASIEIVPTKKFVSFPLFFLVWPLLFLLLTHFTDSVLVLVIYLAIVFGVSVIVVNYFIYFYSQRVLVRWCIYAGIKILPEPRERGVPTAIVGFPCHGLIFSIGYLALGVVLPALFKPTGVWVDGVLGILLCFALLQFLRGYLWVIRKDAKALVQYAKTRSTTLTRQIVFEQNVTSMPSWSTPIFEYPKIGWMLKKALLGFPSTKSRS